MPFRITKLTRALKQKLSRTPQFDLSTPEVIRDPYSLYQELRLRRPVHWDPQTQTWYLSKYEDVVSALRDPEHFSSVRQYQYWSQELQNSMTRYIHHFSKWMINMDAPDHSRVRAAVSGFLTPSYFKNLESRIRNIVDDLLAKAAEKRKMDVVHSLALPLPTMVICEIIGIPSRDAMLFRMWAEDFLSVCNPKQSQQSMMERIEYLKEFINERRRNPQEDLISALIAAETNGKIDEDEICAQCLMLFVGGHETTQDLIGDGTLALLAHPDQLQKLKDDPSLVTQCVEELLRYDSPVQRVARSVARDIVVRGKRLRKGQNVLLLIGAANRDPEKFPNPDTLDITRRGHKHIAFGFGKHFCLGVMLTRLEARMAFAGLIRTFPNMRLATDKIDWQLDHPSLRRLKSLDVVF